MSRGFCIDDGGRRAAPPRDGWCRPVLFLAASTLCIVWLGLAAQRGRSVLAVFPPWWTDAASLVATAGAGGRLIMLGRWPGAVVAQSDDPAFQDRLRSAGAWLLLDARGLTGCATAASGAGS